MESRNVTNHAGKSFIFRQNGRNPEANIGLVLTMSFETCTHTVSQILITAPITTRQYIFFNYYTNFKGYGDAEQHSVTSRWTS